MRLTKTILAQLARDLTIKTYADSLAALNRRINLLNQAYWNKYQQELKERFPLIDGPTWDLLRQCGAMYHHQTARPTIAGSASMTTYSIPKWFQSDIRFDDLRKILTVSTDGEAGCLFDSLSFQLRKAQLKFQVETPLPYMREWDNLPEKGVIARELTLLHPAMEQLLESIAEFHMKAVETLAAFRTLKQLQENFPEAADLVPIPDKPKNINLLPKEQIDSIRAKLNNPPTITIPRG